LDVFYTDAIVEDLEEIKDVVIDMWEPYMSSTREDLSEADEVIVFGRFDVIGDLTETVNKVRRTEHGTLRHLRDDRLKGAKYTWLKGSKKRTCKDNQTIRVPASSRLKVGGAWAINEAVLRLWEYRSVSWAKKYFKCWYFWATHSHLEPIIKVARMMKRHLDGILGYLRNSCANALTEGVNSKIQEIKYRARGSETAKTSQWLSCFTAGGSMWIHSKASRTLFSSNQPYCRIPRGPNYSTKILITDEVFYE
jgi:transposase